MHSRLHWGCGPITPAGWVNSDIHAWPGVTVVADIRAGLPFPDNQFDCLVSMHALPELTYRELDPAFRELRRVLRSGGTLRLGLPDMDRAIQAYRARDVDYFLIGDDVVQDLAGKMIVQLTWFGACRCLFNPTFTTELLMRNGFADIIECGFQTTATSMAGITDLDNRPLESFFVEARKP